MINLNSECGDIDECVSSKDVCHNSRANCLNTPGSFTCSCTTGYSGDGVTCNDINECEVGTDNCGIEASCVNTIGSFNCICSFGYTGDGMKCTEDDCRTHGCEEFYVCRILDNQYACVCQSNYTRTNCSDEIAGRYLHISQIIVQC
ncbi:fibrillin-2-like isoform X16 [Paramuricea clavata]|uniref:Fibrillin-2-like isoform X16 n=1 Tax=Paramuricea clavata TaxID=317549 RepID=A0A7D9JW84_PARCT|nr:fibrillin-2-like isoform X16 [Paramuricea clavata]